jgi:hypothetical protein
MLIRGDELTLCDPTTLPPSSSSFSFFSSSALPGIRCVWDGPRTARDGSAAVRCGASPVSDIRSTRGAQRRAEGEQALSSDYKCSPGHTALTTHHTAPTTTHFLQRQPLFSFDPLFLAFLLSHQAALFLRASCMRDQASPTIISTGAACVEAVLRTGSDLTYADPISQAN